MTEKKICTYCKEEFEETSENIVYAGCYCCGQCQRSDYEDVIGYEP